MAGTHPETRIDVLSVPEGCMCAWGMHGERMEEGGKYTGLYWFTMKYRYYECPAKRNGEHA